MNATKQDQIDKNDIRIYRAALGKAGLIEDQIQGCEKTDAGWLIMLDRPAGVTYLLTPDGEYHAR